MWHYCADEAELAVRTKPDRDNGDWAGGPRGNCGDAASLPARRQVVGKLGRGQVGGRDAGRDEDALLLALLWLWEMWESSGRGPSVLCLQPIIRGLSDERSTKYWLTRETKRV